MLPLRDKFGREIKEFDVLKMYHFTGGSRSKKYYMYKWVIIKHGYMYGHHLGKKGEVDAFMLSQGLLSETEIVQGFDENGKTFEDRPRSKDPTPSMGTG